MALPSVDYTRRDPAADVLPLVVRDHLQTFLAGAAHLRDGEGVPAFDVDVLACPRCGGRLRLIALIESSSVARRILTHLGLPAAVPRPTPARAPPTGDDDEWPRSS